jgi:hypothetical protein
LFAQAVNDDFASALPLLSTYPDNTATGDSSAATLELNEPLPLGCGYDVGNTVWHSFTPPADGHYTFNLAGSDYDTVLAVYTGGSIDSLTQIGCNDDASTRILSSALLLRDLRSATTYWIQIGGFRQGYGQYQVAVEQYGLRSLSAPRQTNPSHGYTLVDQTPWFEWDAVADAFAYQLQLSTDSRFRTLIVDPAPIRFVTNYIPPSDLPPGRYYWRVATLNASGISGRFSSTRVFYIDLASPAALIPAQDSLQTTTQPTFRW